jgi:hypothetical protein
VTSRKAQNPKWANSKEEDEGKVYLTPINVKDVFQFSKNEWQVSTTE